MSALHLKELRRVYGFDEVAIAPGSVTINPDLTNTDFSVDGITLSTPVLGGAMDAVSSPKFVSEMDRLGGMAVTNMEGVHSRYDDPQSVIEEIVETPLAKVTSLLQKVYSAPLREELVGQRVEDIKRSGARCAVSFTPSQTKQLAPLAAEAGADVIVVQSTVTTARHISKSERGLRFPELLELIDVPVIVGNCVSYDVALELMTTGIHGVLVGVGPGAACTTREVTGVGIPQVTATMDAAAAATNTTSARAVRSHHHDGGIRTGGDLCKAMASGADAVMIGTPLAQSEEAPGRGYNWGMAKPGPQPAARNPRQRRRERDAGADTLRPKLGDRRNAEPGGALNICLGMVGAENIREMHEVAEVVVAPSIKTEGKHYQLGLE